METISEQEFIKLCDGIYNDLGQVHEWNPSLSARDAFLWMLLGSLVSLLSVPILDQPSVYDPSKSDPYLLAVLEVLAGRCEGSFDPTGHLSELLGQIDE